MGITTTAAGSVEILDLAGLEGKTFRPDGSGTAGETYDLDLTHTADVNDYLRIVGNTGSGTVIFVIFKQGGDGAFSTGGGSNPSALFYNNGETIDGQLNQAPDYGYLVKAGTNKSGWTSDLSDGALGFQDSDGNFGYLSISWVASSQTLTVISGAFENSGGSITAGAVPEPSEYAAALGLGALGLAYYRRRQGNKTRSKN